MSGSVSELSSQLEHTLERAEKLLFRARRLDGGHHTAEWDQWHQSEPLDTWARIDRILAELTARRKAREKRWRILKARSFKRSINMRGWIVKAPHGFAPTSWQATRQKCVAAYMHGKREAMDEDSPDRPALTWKQLRKRGWRTVRAQIIEEKAIEREDRKGKRKK
jgi:hypothetical protein